MSRAHFFRGIGLNRLGVKMPVADQQRVATGLQACMIAHVCGQQGVLYRASMYVKACIFFMFVLCEHFSCTSFPWELNRWGCHTTVPCASDCVHSSMHAVQPSSETNDTTTDSINCRLHSIS